MSKTKAPKQMPIAPTKCATCPFRVGSEYSYLAESLHKDSLRTASRICHSTGSNAIHARTGKSEQLCRGVRDGQLAELHRRGFIAAPTDAAWTAKCAELGIAQDCSTKPRRTRRKKGTL